MLWLDPRLELEAGGWLGVGASAVGACFLVFRVFLTSVGLGCCVSVFVGGSSFFEVSLFGCSEDLEEGEDGLQPDSRHV